MTLDEIRGVLAAAIVLRTPRFEEGASAKEKVSALEDNLLEAAYAHGALVEAKHFLRQSEDHLSRQLDELQGYEAMLPAKKAAYTKAEVSAAKARAAPELFAAGREARRLRGSVDDQIKRFEWEYTVLSRIYTMISGS